MMHICSDLVGPKREHVQNTLLLLLIFEGPRVPGAFQEYEENCEKGCFFVEKQQRTSKNMENEKEHKKGNRKISRTTNNRKRQRQCLRQRKLKRRRTQKKKNNKTMNQKNKQ